jgi:hypothetical protein
MKTSIDLFSSFIGAGTNPEISFQLNFAVNQNLILINSGQNVLIKRIELSAGVNNGAVFTKFFDCRLRALNQDGSINRVNGGDIINPISGPWGNAFVKNTDVDFVLSTKKNFIEFKEGILLGGFQVISSSAQFVGTTASGFFYYNTLTIDYEK